jgi:two-component system, NarL family, nitrate/nitrite response regulator NarL
MDENVISIGVVDDYPIFRDGIVHALSQESDFRVVGEGESAADALRICAASGPHVMLIGLSMPGGGNTAICEIRERHPKVGVIVLTVEDTFESVSAALSAGARGYLLKECGARELNDTIRVVAGGGTYVPPDLAAGLLFSQEKETSSERKVPQSAPLSEREKQVFTLLGLGRSNREIATELGLTEKTAKWYVSNVLGKLGLENRLQAAMVAGEHTRR